MRVHWVTWWPVPYWTERFNALSTAPDTELKVFFLARGGGELTYLSRPESWTFEACFLRNEDAPVGYYGLDLRILNPLPVLAGRPDVVVVNYGSVATASIALLTNLARVPRFVFVPNTQDEPRVRSTVKERVKAWMFRSSDGLLVTGAAQRAYAEGYVGNTVPIHVVGNPAPPLALAVDGPAPAREADPPVVLFVGRFVPEKGLDILLRACAELVAGGVALRLVLVGDGPLRSELEEQARSLGVAAAFPGFEAGVALRASYGRAAVFVLPSRREPWGLVVNEAMECGLPVVVSDRVGARTELVVDGVNGCVFPCDDVPALAACLHSLLGDSQRRSSYGAASRRRIRGHTISSWVDAVQGALRQACG